MASTIWKFSRLTSKALVRLARMPVTTTSSSADSSYSSWAETDWAERATATAMLVLRKERLNIYYYSPEDKHFAMSQHLLLFLVWALLLLRWSTNDNIVL